MGCGASKHGVVAATGTCVSYRRRLRTRTSAAASSHFKTGRKPQAHAPTAAIAAVSDVEEVTVEVDVVRMAAAAGVEEEAGSSRAALPPEGPPSGQYSTTRSTDEGGGGGACTGDVPAGPPEADSNEKGGGCAPEDEEEDQKMACSRAAAPKLCDAHDASSEAAGPGGHGSDGVLPADDQREKLVSSPDQCNHVKMDQDLRMQLQQVAEQLADFQVWSSIPEEEEGDDGDDDSDKSDTDQNVVTAEEEGKQHQEEGLNSPVVVLEEEDHPDQVVEEPVFKEEDDNDDNDDRDDQFGDAAEVFKEDFSSKIPVYDEYPHDLIPQEVPTDGCDFSAEGNAITSYNLSFGTEGIDDDQIQQVLYQKFVKIRRSKPYESGGKNRRTHYLLHQKQIRKRRKRKSL